MGGGELLIKRAGKRVGKALPRDPSLLLLVATSLRVDPRIHPHRGDAMHRVQ